MLKWNGLVKTSLFAGSVALAVSSAYAGKKMDNGNPLEANCEARQRHYHDT